MAIENLDFQADNTSDLSCHILPIARIRIRTRNYEMHREACHTQTNAVSVNQINLHLHKGACPLRNLQSNDQ